MPTYNPRTGLDEPDPVEVQSETTIDSTAQPSEGLQLAGHDGLTYVAVTARKHGGRTHLYVRDEALLEAISELTLAIHELTGVIGDEQE